MDNAVDANIVIQKLQIRLAEAFTTIAVLEARIEQLHARALENTSLPEKDELPQLDRLFD